MNTFEKHTKYISWSIVLLISTALAACGDNGKDPILGIGGVTPTATPTPTPVPTVFGITVNSTTPINRAVNVCPNATISANFDAALNVRLDPATVNATTFTLLGPGNAAITASTISLDTATGRTATFTPQNLLNANSTYTATLLGGSSGVKDTGSPVGSMMTSHTWSFTTVPTAGSCGPSVILGLAEPFGIAATAGVTNTPTTPTTLINGDVVLDPNQTCNAVTVDNTGGFGLCGGSPPSVNGTVITNIFPNTTTSSAVKADLNAAYLSITPSAGPPAAGSLDGGTPIAAPTNMGAVTGSALVVGQNLFYPGVYKSITSIRVQNDLTLDGQGDPNARFVFQSASTVDTAAGAPAPATRTRILLVNGANAANVWWQAGSSATLGLYSEFNGNILAAFSITMGTGATSCGRLMAGAWVGGGGAFVFDSNVVSVPGRCPP